MSFGRQHFLGYISKPIYAAKIIKRKREVLRQSIHIANYLRESCFARNTPKFNVSFFKQSSFLGSAMVLKILLCTSFFNGKGKILNKVKITCLQHFDNS